jgi:hypothetical protein
MRRVTKRIVVALGVVALAGGLAGCSGDPTAKEVAALNKSNIQRVANLYTAFQTYKGGRGPKSEAEFKEFITAFDADKLKMMGVNSGDLGALFTSERDGKPFKVRYGVGGGRGSVDAVVFEQDGVGGTKQVGFTTGKVEDLDDATYQQLWAAKPAAPTKAASTKAAPNGAGRPSGPPSGAPTGPRT